jgi:hypothetical protein
MHSLGQSVALIGFFLCPGSMIYCAKRSYFGNYQIIKSLVDVEMSETQDILIQHRMQREDFKCIICLELTHPPFYQCNGGLHFVCPNCCAKLSSDSCPSCRDNTLSNNKLLERDLSEYLVECPYFLCKKTVFQKFIFLAMIKKQ